MSNSNSQQTQAQKLGKAASGVQQQFPATVKLTLSGQSYSPAQIAQVLTAAVTAIDAVTPAKAQLQQLVKSRGATLKVANQLYVVLKKYLESLYGKGSPELAAFGISTALPKQPSSETKALAKAKAKLTRKARGTKGSREKLLVTPNGSPGLVLFGPDGKPIPGITQGPTPPALTGDAQSNK
ncbi:MAG: hypothetical protein ACYCWW_16190 [Deltaproteobacteria bacterium]